MDRARTDRAAIREEFVAGVVSDTHGLVRPEMLEALRGVSAIFHAGDIGSPEVLRALERIAPVHAVRGNNDRDIWARAIPETLTVELMGLRIYLIHDRNELAIDAAAENIDIVISGHSHRPSLTETDGIIFLNPGSTGPRRFSLPVALAKVILGGRGAGQKPRVELIELAVTASKSRS